MVNWEPLWKSSGGQISKKRAADDCSRAYKFKLYNSQVYYFVCLFVCILVQISPTNGVSAGTQLRPLARLKKTPKRTNTAAQNPRRVWCSSCSGVDLESKHRKVHWEMEGDHLAQTRIHVGV